MTENMIRQDLRNGLTIGKVCTKYNLSFKELCEILNNVTRGRPVNKSTGEMYITPCSTGDVVLSKNNVHYGQYSCVEDAVRVRDYFIFHGWSKRRLDEVCELLGVVRCRK